MTSRYMLTLIAAATLFSGCTRTPPAAETPIQPMPSSDWVASYRATIEQGSPGSIVGVVNAVMPEQNLASVSDIPAGSLSLKQTLTFIDGDGNPLGVGEVISVTEYGNVHVEYETPQPGRRSPQVGDVAVWLKK